MPSRDPYTPGLLARLPVEPKKVALLRPSRIGDFICAIPALRALCHALPQAHLTVISVPLLRPLIERLPYVDAFAPFPGFPRLAEQLFDPVTTLHFFQRMQAERFDLAIQLQGSGVYSNPFLLMLGAKYNAGFVRAGDVPARFDAALPLPLHGHEIHRTLALPVFLGAPPCGVHTEFPLTTADASRAQALLQHLHPPLIGLHPPANDPRRRWPLAHFAAAGQSLQRRFGGTLVLLGGAAESAYNRQLAAVSGGACCDLTGCTSLGTLAAVLTQLTVLITSDSGPAHIAYALGAPTVTVFRAHGARRYGPLTPGPFRALEPLADSDCVAVDQVVQAATELIECNHPQKSAAPYRIRSAS